MNNYYNKYILSISKKLEEFDLVKANLLEKKIKDLKKKKKKIIFFGNGGSVALSNHFSVDFNKNLKINTLTFNESTITCLSNDFGYENWMKKALDLNVVKGDLVVFISSSGNSMNHLNAAKFCKKRKIFSVSFTGFKKINYRKLPISASQ